MSISWLLVVLGLAVFAGAVWALFWAVDNGQYDDLEAKGRIIFDDEPGNGDIPDFLANGDRPAGSDPSFPRR
jgi:cbb3-type cytochrome oxidase maturation protein